MHLALSLIYRMCVCINTGNIVQVHKISVAVKPIILFFNEFLFVFDCL